MSYLVLAAGMFGPIIVASHIAAVSFNIQCDELRTAIFTADGPVDWWFAEPTEEMGESSNLVVLLKNPLDTDKVWDHNGPRLFL